MMETQHNFSLDYEYIALTATDAQIRIAKDFAPKYAQSVLDVYSKRGQSDLNTIIQQAIPSKIFEYMVYNYLRTQGQCTPPDVKIYGANEKSFDADLTFINKSNRQLKIHVKSQDFNRIRGRETLSWGFQMSDELYQAPQLFDYVYAGVIVSPTEGHLLIRKAATRVMYLARDPLKENLRSNKKFLYYSDVDSMNPLEKIMSPSRLIK